jgi:hypothetical protein
MLSEFLISLHSSAAHQPAHVAHGGYTLAAGPSFHPARGSARWTAAGAGSRTQQSTVKRTVVHRRKRRDDLAGPCNHCGALTSPQWRKGPKGKPVLCNACGIRFLRNRTLTKVMVGGSRRQQVEG